MDLMRDCERAGVACHRGSLVSFTSVEILTFLVVSIVRLREVALRPAASSCVTVRLATAAIDGMAKSVAALWVVGSVGDVMGLLEVAA